MPETWTTYRRALGEALGWHMFTSQSSTGAAASSGVLVCPELIDTNLEANFLDTTWEYQPTGGNAGEVRRVAKGGLAPATGTITLSRAHTAASSSSATVEFYGVLPPVRALGRRGLLQAANLALAECWGVDTVYVTGVANQYQYPLSTAYPWLDTSDRLIDVAVRQSGALRDTLVPGWRWLNDQGVPQVEFGAPFNTTDTIKLLVYRPLNTWIKVGATWADSTVGLVNETDQALLSQQGMMVVGLYWCYEFLASEGDQSQRAYWRSLADRQRIKANNWKRWSLPRLEGRDAHGGYGPASLSLIGNGVAFDAGLYDL